MDALRLIKLSRFLGWTHVRYSGLMALSNHAAASELHVASSDANGDEENRGGKQDATWLH
jgi:hypothetical protein